VANNQSFFSKAKSQSSTFKKPQNSCPPEKLVEHFKYHFNPPHPSRITTFLLSLRNSNVQLSHDHLISNDAPNREEVYNALAKLKNNKSSNDKFMDTFILLVEENKRCHLCYKTIPVNNKWPNHCTGFLLFRDQLHLII